MQASDDRSIRMLLIGATLLFSVLSCAAPPVWRAEYLGQQVNLAKQDEVREKFGEPQETRPAANGDEVWVYRIGKNAKYGDPATYGEGSVLIGSGECVAYVLTFDKQGTLRSWLRQEC